LPERVAEFRSGVAKAIDYTCALGVPQLNCLAGKAPIGSDHKQLHDTFVGNLQYAASELKKAGLKLLIEPINTFDIPGFYLSKTEQGIAVLDAVGADNAFLQYDIYHAQRMEGELGNTIQKYFSRIGHIQLADNPGRNEPGTGEINYTYLFDLIDRLEYAGYVGCEYKPLKTTEAGLGWMGHYEQH
jgi:hydroxypyruvate isomerase